MINPSYARVIIDRSIHRELDYLIPETLADKVSIGSRVRVPFRERSALATVVALLTETDAEGIRPIEALVGDKPALSPKLVELGRWMSTSCCARLRSITRHSAHSRSGALFC
jgi:primosomal protein N' (replication factor Y)